MKGKSAITTKITNTHCISQDSLEKQTNRRLHTHTHTHTHEIHSNKLAHAIVEVEKSHDLPSVSWRSRKPGKLVVSIQSKSKDLRTWSTDGEVPSKRAGEDLGLSSISQAEIENSTLQLLFSIRALNGLDDAHPHWGG